MALQIDNLPQPGDTEFLNSPDAGHPKCLCSRCGQKIEEWHAPCLRVWPQNENLNKPAKTVEYRYHWGCVGGTDRTKEEYEAEQDDFYSQLDLP